MGWYFSSGSKQGLIRDLTKESRFSTSDGIEVIRQTLDYSLRGSVLYSVKTTTEIESGKELDRWIQIDLIKYDRSDKMWGYKPMEESMGPFYYDCPLKFLKMVPVVNQEWRNEVVRSTSKRRKTNVGK